MGMQHVYFVFIYEPGKDQADLLDFLSRHPLMTTGNDAVETVVKYVIYMEHAIVMDSIREETLKILNFSSCLPEYWPETGTSKRGIQI